jgi:hypothetical protein
MTPMSSFLNPALSQTVRIVRRNQKLYAFLSQICSKNSAFACEFMFNSFNCFSPAFACCFYQSCELSL